jgi:hypothetical protein
VLVLLVVGELVLVNVGVDDADEFAVFVNVGLLVDVLVLVKLGLDVCVFVFTLFTSNVGVNVI